jgi:allophanate hydrolase
MTNSGEKLGGMCDQSADWCTVLVSNPGGQAALGVGHGITVKPARSYFETVTKRSTSARHGYTRSMDVSLSIASLRAAYVSGVLTPEALVEQLYARMEREPVEGAWIHRISLAQALEQARRLQQRPDAAGLPLFGIPFAVKDNIDVLGMPTTAGCPGYRYGPVQSAACVTALLDAGALCLGKVALDQFATGLIGTRSPYGQCRNVFDPEVVAGGSSSGSALVVATHQVSFALGTDTAGSGRVPAALNNLVGLKPSVGLINTDGVVPACASLDCVSVFALNVPDAARVRDVMARGALETPPLPACFRFGVPAALHASGDEPAARAFADSVELLQGLGGTPVPIDFAPFLALGDQLYGPTVVERYLAVGSFIEAHQVDVLPVTRDIILAGKQVGPGDAIAGMKRIAQLRQRCQHALSQVDVLLTPTIPRPVRLEEDRREPRAANDLLGVYTRFANYLGCPVLALPAGFRSDGLPFGVSLVGKPAQDAQLDTLGGRVHAASGAGGGRRREPAPEPDADAKPDAALVAVVGAHMRGLALNSQLLELGASFVESTRTAARYRLFVLPGGPPERPGLVQVSAGGHAIELEVWQMSWTALGALMSKVPAPLSIGTLELASGARVKGFLCEAVATESARDISALGGYRAYVMQKDAQ